MDFDCRLVSSSPPPPPQDNLCAKPNDDERLVHKCRVRIKGAGQSQGGSFDNPWHFGDMIAK